jgi:hypothetical protein
MAKDKKGFVLYADQKLIFDDLTNEEAGILIKHIFSYVNDENPELNDRLLDMAFKPIKLQLKRDLVKYEGVKERNSANARKRWDAVESSGIPNIPNSTKNADKDNDIVKDKDIDKDNDINISFVCFWNLYNKKINSKDCESKWKKLKDDDRQKIIDTLPNFLNSIPDKQFLPHPATYLNQKRWNDEIIINPNANKKHYYLSSPFGKWDGILTESEFIAKTLTGHFTLIKSENV